MDQRVPRILATATIALVWLINGLFCKVLNMVPRHQEIVGRILGEQHAWVFTKAIGISEIFMAVWIVSGIKSRFCAMCQVVIVAAMNMIPGVFTEGLERENIRDSHACGIRVCLVLF